MSVTRSQSKDNKKQKEHSDQEDILDTTIMASEQQELSGIDKLLQLMQLQSQKLDDNQRKVDRKMDETQQKLDQKMDKVEKKMDDNQQETKQAIEENNKKIEERIEKYEMKIKDHMQKQEMRMKDHMKEQEMKIQNKMKELTNCQKKEMESLENKLQNAIQADIEEVERKIAEINTQQNVGERREMVIHSTDDVKIRFGGDVRRLHPVPFINSLKKKIQHIGNFETAKETIRNHLKYEASLWFDCKEEEFDSWQQFEQKFLNYFWGKVQQLEINKELQNGKYNDRMGISERTYALQIYYNAKHLQYNYSSEQLVELIARHFEETLEDHITLQNYKDIDSLCQFLQIRESRLRERKSRRSREDYRLRETQDYRDRNQNRRDYTRREFNPRRENENRDNGRGNYEQRSQQYIVNHDEGVLLVTFNVS